MPFTEYGCSVILAHVFAKSKLPDLFLAAYRKTDAGVKEIFGGGYERISFRDVEFAVDGEVASNKNDILFPVARRDWGEVVEVAIVDEKGEEVARESLSVVDITVGRRLRLPAGKLTIRLRPAGPS